MRLTNHPTCMGVLFLVAASHCAMLSGAELRMRACNRDICRTAAVQVEPKPQPAVPVPKSEQEPAAGDPLADQVLMPDSLLGDPCAQCGIAGCNESCLTGCGWWARADYLLWWRKGRDLPPLITTSPDGTPQSQAGVLGVSDTDVLFGGGALGQEARPGGRVSVGTWLDPTGCYALEGRFYSLGKQTVNYNASSDGSTIIARPLLFGGSQDAYLVAFPNFTTAGEVDVRSESDVLGGDFLYHWIACQHGNTRLDFLAGYQFARISEDLVVNDTTQAVGNDHPLVDRGSTIAHTDQFETRNEFHGGVLGLTLKHHGAGWHVEALAKVALGNMYETVTISGQETVTTRPPNSTTSQRDVGLLARGSNLGRFTRSTFAVSPELGLTLVWELSDCLDLSVGYSYLYWNNAVQPGDQIDPNLTVPTTQYQIVDKDYWLHGVHLGAELRF